MRFSIRTVCITLCVCLLMGAFPLLSSAATFGDINGDSKVNTNDVRCLLSTLVSSAPLGETQAHLADVNRDSKCNTDDARLMMQMIVAGNTDSLKIYSGAKLVTFGDSLTAFGTWPSAVAQSCNMTLFNGALGGTTSAQGLERFDNYVANRNPDFVTLCFGMNDLIMTAKSTPRVSLAQYRANLKTLVSKVRALDATPILMTVSYLDESVFYTVQAQDPAWYAEVGSPLQWLDCYNAVVREVAAEDKVALVDIRKACDNYAVKDFLVDDGIHLDTLGNQVYASLISDCIQSNFSVDPTVPQIENTLDCETSPAGTDVHEILSHSPADWYTVDASTMQFATSGAALTICNTNSLWPEAHFTLEKAYVVPYQDTELVFDFTTANANASIILFLGGATPSVYQADQTLCINSKIASTNDVGDISANQTVKGSIKLRDLGLPAGAFDQNDNVIISGVKVFVAGNAYQPITFNQFAVKTYGAPTM